MLAFSRYNNDVKRTNQAFVSNPFFHEEQDKDKVFVSHWGKNSHPDAPLVGPKLIKLYNTGDRGRLLANGELELAGRDDNIIKIRGFKVGLLMVENALLSFTDIVKSCVVIPMLDPETKQPISLSCYVVGPEGRPTTKQCESLLLKMRTKVPNYAVPEYCVPMSSFPTRPGSGKMDKSRFPLPTDGVRSTTISGGGSGSRNRSPSLSGETNQLEKILSKVWRKILGKDVQFSSHDNFFEIGGHSLKAATLVGILTDTFGLNLTVVDIYSSPTIASLSNLLRDRLGVRTESTQTLTRRSISKFHDVHARGGRNKQQRIGDRVDVAVIGMAGKFPGAPDIETFWRNLMQGKDSLRTFTKEVSVLLFVVCCLLILVDSCFCFFKFSFLFTFFSLFSLFSKKIGA